MTQGVDKVATMATHIARGRGLEFSKEPLRGTNFLFCRCSLDTCFALIGALRSCFIGPCYVDISKRFSRSISLAICYLYTLIDTFIITNSDKGDNFQYLQLVKLIVTYLLSYIWLNILKGTKKAPAVDPLWTF